jgi:hypothetical protein
MSSIDRTTPAPQAVTTSYWLYIVGGILGLIGAVIVGVLIPSSIAAATSSTTQALQGQSANGVDVSGTVTAVAVVLAVLSIVLSLVFAVLMLVLAPRMRRGSNRARITLIVLAALQVFGLLGSYGVGALHFLVVLVALILSVLPASNAWFRSMKPTVPPTA